MTRTATPRRIVKQFGASPVAALGATATQALTSFLLMATGARILGIDDLGSFSILYGTLILGAALTTGFVGDTLTVLDRFDPNIRAGLSRWLLALGVAASVVAFTATAATGLLSPGEAALFAAATFAYLSEDILRRVLSASLSFHRLIAVDMTAMVSTLAALALFLALLPVGVGTFIAAVLAGQVAAIGIGVRILPATERGTGGGDPAWREVAAYGLWRAAQQCLRPGTLTVVRISLLGMIGFAAAGELELARTYCAPAMLLVTGVCSYIFPSLARDGHKSLASLLRITDRNVRILAGLTIGAGLVALFLLPVAGPMITGSVPDTLAVTGWLAYAAAVGAATPYGQLAAIRGRPRSVFLIRLLDTVFSIIVALAVIGATGHFGAVPWACALGAVLGGLAIRSTLLAPQIRRTRGRRAAGPRDFDRPRPDSPAQSPHRANAGSLLTEIPALTEERKLP